MRRPALSFDEFGVHSAGAGANPRQPRRNDHIFTILPSSPGRSSSVRGRPSVSGGRTRSAIRAVSGEDRVHEIARMLGGEKASSVVVRHARELLALAQ